MTYLLDTNACSGYLNGRAIGVFNRLQTLPLTEVSVCSIVKAELFAGAAKSTDPAATLAKQQAFLSRFVSLPFDDAAAQVFGRIRGYLEMAGKPIGPYDLQIAAIALSNNLTLVTHNTREFGRIPGLMLDDWEI